MRGIFLLHCFFVACYAASILDLYFQFDLYGAFYFTALITPFNSGIGCLFLFHLGRLLVLLHERALHIYQLCFNPETVRGETWYSSFCCWCGETLVFLCVQIFFSGILGFFLYALTMDFLDKPTPVWHAILSYFYIVCFYPWLLVWNSSGGFLFPQEDYGTVRSSDTTQQDDGIHKVVNSRLGDVAESFVELRRLEEQEKTISKDETATVTTEEDDDDRRQTTDSLDSFA
jgi:hypothetical protein